MLRSRSIVSVVAIALAAAAAVPLAAQPLAIANPGFEQSVLAPGAASAGAIAGWTILGGGSDPAGVMRPAATAFPNGAPQGNNVAYSNGGTIAQVLGHVLVPAAYRLEVDAGARADLASAGYTIRLLAGGVVIGELSAAAGPAPGTFERKAVIAHVAPGHPQLGQPLEIRLGAPAAQTAFDRVGIVRVPLSARSENALRAAGGASQDEFGWSVFTDDGAAIIGAPGDDANGGDAGAAYVFRRTNGAWAQEQKLLPAGGAAGARFGNGVSLRGDLAAIGAPNASDAGIASGAVWVFRRSGAVWTQEARLLASDRADGDLFGYSVSVSGDTVVVGSPFRDDSGTNSGSAYVFRRIGATWIQEQKLVPAAGHAGDLCGLSVSLDADVAVVGAPFDDDHGLQAGAAWIFRRAGGAWQEEQKLLSADGEAHDELGSNVAISGGAVVLASSYDDDNGSNAGAAYVFRAAGGAWTQEQKLLARDGAAGDRLGFSVAVHGEVAMVGAPVDAELGSLSGSAYLFRHTGGGWVEEQKLLASDRRSSDQLGFSVSVGATTALAGARSGTGLVPGAGSAYAFEAGGPPADSRLLGRRTWGPLHLEAQTGSAAHYGVQILNGEGFVTAPGSGGVPPHQVHVVDGQGFYIRSFDQHPSTASSPAGYRDGATDGVSLLFGFEAGIHVVDPASGALVPMVQSANGLRAVVNPIVPGTSAAPQLAVARALAFDRQGDGGNGSLWVADAGSDLLEIDLGGAVLRRWPLPPGWSIGGLAFDAITGRLWASIGADVAEFDPATGAPTGAHFPRLGGGPSPAGLCEVPGGISGLGGLDLVALDPAMPCRIAGYRVHAYASVDGTREASLVAAAGQGAWSRQSPITVAPGEVLHLGFDLSSDPVGLAGRPVAVFVSPFRDAFVEADTFGIRELTAPLGNGTLSWSTPAPILPPLVIGDGFGVGALTGIVAPLGLDSLGASLALPIGTPLPPLRVQGLYLEPAIQGAPAVKATNAIRID